MQSSLFAVVARRPAPESHFASLTPENVAIGVFGLFSVQCKRVFSAKNVKKKLQIKSSNLKPIDSNRGGLATLPST
jgi:hypothetical protein